jgi:hypothetical protein
MGPIVPPFRDSHNKHAHDVRAGPRRDREPDCGGLVTYKKQNERVSFVAVLVTVFQAYDRNMTAVGSGIQTGFSDPGVAEYGVLGPPRPCMDVAVTERSLRPPVWRFGGDGPAAYPPRDGYRRRRVRHSRHSQHHSRFGTEQFSHSRARSEARDRRDEFHDQRDPRRHHRGGHRGAERRGWRVARRSRGPRS